MAEFRANVQTVLGASDEVIQQAEVAQRHRYAGLKGRDPQVRGLGHKVGRVLQISWIRTICSLRPKGVMPARRRRFGKSSDGNEGTEWRLHLS